MSERTSSITILTEYFAPEEASTAQLLTELTTSLTDHFDVRVVTCYPNYHDDDRNRTVPGTDVFDGVVVKRVRATQFDKQSLLKRMLNWLSFTVLTLVHLLQSRRDDALLVLSNPPILPFVAWIIRRIRGTPYVYVVFDVYPDMPIELGILSRGGIVARIWRRSIHLFYRDADRIVVLGESMQRHVEREMADYPAFDPEKIEIIPNWEDPSFIKPKAKTDNEFAREQGTVDAFTLLYSGNIGRFHELETAVDAINCLERRGRTDIKLLIIGEGDKKTKLQRIVNERDVDNVSFLPFQPRERLPETLTCGDAWLVGVKPAMAGLCVSSKLYSALASGQPILATVGKQDEIARVVRGCDCGAYARPGDPDRVADILESWADDPEQVARLGRNARECFEANYTLNQSTAAYERVLRSVVS